MDGGIKFGMWGYCVEQTGVCTPRGYVGFLFMALNRGYVE